MIDNQSSSTSQLREMALTVALPLAGISLASLNFAFKRVNCWYLVKYHGGAVYHRLDTHEPESISGDNYLLAEVRDLLGIPESAEDNPTGRYPSSDTPSIISPHFYLVKYTKFLILLGLAATYAVRTAMQWSTYPQSQDPWWFLATPCIGLLLWGTLGLAYGWVNIIRSTDTNQSEIHPFLTNITLLTLAICFLANVFLGLLAGEFPAETLGDLWRTPSALTDTIQSTLMLGVAIVALWTEAAPRCVMVPDPNRPDDPPIRLSPEGKSSIIHHFSFSWLNDILRAGHEQVLGFSDLWHLPRDNLGFINWTKYRQTARPNHSLAWNIYHTLCSLIHTQFFLSALRYSLKYSNVYFMNLFLRYIQHPKEAPKSVAYGYVLGIFLSSWIVALISTRALFLGRHISFRINGILAGELARKILVRNQHQLVQSEPSPGENSKDNEPESELEVGSTGKIMNLASNDIRRIAEASAYVMDIICIPLELGVGVYFLYQLLGVSAFIGLVSMLLTYPLNQVAFRKAIQYEDTLSSISDRRVSVITEMLSGMRIIKMFGWEANFMDRIQSIRLEQLRVLKKYLLTWSLIDVSVYIGPLAMLSSAFGSYSLIFGHTLTADVAFTSWSVFQMVQDAFFTLLGYGQYFISCRVSLLRVDRFLHQEDVEPPAEWAISPESARKTQPTTTDSSQPDSTLGFVHATFSWNMEECEASLHDGNASSSLNSVIGTSHQPKLGSSTSTDISSASTSSKDVLEVDSVSSELLGSTPSAQTFTLTDLCLQFPPGKITLIVGPTGSGKTSLLMALLGEMPRVSGQVVIPTARGHLDDLAYVSQEAWLRNATIRDNILFGAPYDEVRYRQVLHGCALVPDLRILKGGDLTEVGEKGVTLSGGQKQRIALARAMYSSATHLLLDDSLSAVDSHTAQAICKNCLGGPLLKGRTCLLVTHHVQLCLDLADYMVVMDKGRGVVAHGAPSTLVYNGAVSSILLTSAMEGLAQEEALTAQGTSLTAADPGQSEVAVDDDIAPSVDPLAADTIVLRDASDKASGQLIEEEEVEQGQIKFSVYRTYFEAAGSLWYWAFVFIMLVLIQLVKTLHDYWVRIWVSSTSQTSPTVSTHEQSVISSGVLQFSVADNVRDSSLASMVYSSFDNSLRYWWSTFTPMGFTTLTRSESTSSKVPWVQTVEFFMTVYVGIGIVVCLMRLGHSVLAYLRGSYRASVVIHERLLKAVARAQPHFFDSTPMGRIVNRFSGDMRTLDEHTMASMSFFWLQLIGSLGTLLVISLITPAFAVVALVIIACNFYSTMYFLDNFREFKRIESVRLAPMLSLFNELIYGITSVRAYGAQARYIAGSLRLSDNYNRPFYLLWAINRWLQYRTDVFGALVSLGAGLLIMWRLDSIDAGIAGFSMSYSLTFSSLVYWVVRNYSEVEMGMNSMERIQQYCQTDQEAPPVVEDYRPPVGWPSRGEIQVKDLTVEYQSGVRVLHPLTFTIQPGEKIGLVGRTGAGKSTLGLSFLRFVEPSTGSIIIDGLDINQMGLDDLRRRITMIPQDPILFKGTLRSNLDPFDEHEDHILWSALHSTHLTLHSTLSLSTGCSNRTSQVSLSALAGKSDSLKGKPGLRTRVAELVAEEVGEPNLDDHNRSDDVETNRSVASPAGSTTGVFDTLEAPIEEGGKNLSLGQRQLVALARALVRQSKVIIMDEATASVDFETDRRIQITIRKEFSAATLLCIAHRLRTIIDYDRIMVLDHGQLAEFDTPLTLLETPGSLFRSMCEKSGELELLLSLARQRTIAL